MSRLAAVVAALVLASGCASYRLVRDGKVQITEAERIKAELEQVRGLRFREPVPVTAVSATEARNMLEREVRRTYTSQDLATLGRVYVALGLLPPGTDLERAFLDLYAGQIAGFYDPIERRMVLVEGSYDGGLLTRIVEGVIRRDLTGELVLAHELTHALQDQNFGLDIGRADFGEGDAQLAERAVYEGDATLAGFAVVAGTMQPGGAVSLARKLEGIPSQLARIYPETPALIRETVVFQYVGGVNFVSWAYKNAGWEGVNALLTRPPRSTEQILHPEKYFVKPEYPLAIRIGALAPYLGEGWDLVENTTVGELVMRVLGERYLDAGRAHALAAGWDGDRLAALARGSEVATLWLSSWDSEDDAREFFAGYLAILAAKRGEVAPPPSGDVVSSAAGPNPFYLERQRTRVLAIEGPLEPDLAAAAERVWRRSTFEVTIPWLPLELAGSEARGAPTEQVLTTAQRRRDLACRDAAVDRGAAGVLAVCSSSQAR